MLYRPLGRSSYCFVIKRRGNTAEVLLFKASGTGSEKFTRNVQALLDHYLEDIEAEIGKPAAQMDKPEKLQALA